MLWVLLICCWFLESNCTTLEKEENQYKNGIDLDAKGHFHFEWSVDYRNDTVVIRLTAKMLPTSWFAIGFSDYGLLTNADLVVFWTDQDNVHHFVDSHTNSHGVLQADQQQDYHVTAASSIQGDVVIEFHRLFDTRDKYDYKLDNGTTHVIYVTSKDQSESPLGHDVTKLSHGLQRTQILKPDLPQIIFPDDTWTFEVRAPEVLVPAKETTYWWHTTVLPSLHHPHHIIKYEGIISEGSEDLVHHMEVFHCVISSGVQIPFYNGPGLSEGKPKGLEPCRKVIGAWAMGAQPMVYPVEAGVPVGGPEFSRFALLEVHYNNPSKKAGHMDRSGIRFYVTSQLRQFDAGIMELGLEYTNKMAIPPHQKEFQLSGYCVGECTDVGLPPRGIQVFASQLHTHLTGKRAYTRHFRHGQELPELNRDNHYSPHYQEIRQLSQPVHVMPEDLLIHTCVFDTTSRSKATVGGFAITDEMCVNYIHYYPRTQLEVCKSSVETSALKRFFSYLNGASLSHLEPDSGDRSVYTHIEWTPVTNNLLEFMYATAPLSMQCNKSDGHRFPGEWGHVPVPDIYDSIVLH